MDVTQKEAFDLEVWNIKTLYWCVTVSFGSLNYNIIHNLRDQPGKYGLVKSKTIIPVSFQRKSIFEHPFGKIRHKHCNLCPGSNLICICYLCFRGAGQEVGRSCIILEFKGKKIMVGGSWLQYKTLMFIIMTVYKYRPNCGPTIILL